MYQLDIPTQTTIAITLRPAIIILLQICITPMIIIIPTMTIMTPTPSDLRLVDMAITIPTGTVAADIMAGVVVTVAGTVAAMAAACVVDIVNLKYRDDCGREICRNIFKKFKLVILRLSA
jgi:hypothetical protein